MNKYENLSKEVSYALRHAPWEYELELDTEGWVPVQQLVDSLRKNSSWHELSISDLAEMIRLSSKKRHEIVSDKIRALYGHSIPMKIAKLESTPPAVLYHGTSDENIPSIIANGLLPMGRQYVHLSEDIETATIVGKRKGGNLVILSIDTEKVIANGEKFYLGNEKVWLADYIPANCVKVKGL